MIEIKKFIFPQDLKEIESVIKIRKQVFIDEMNFDKE